MRLLIGLTLAAVLAPGVAACGGDDDGGSAATPTPTPTATATAQPANVDAIAKGIGKDTAKKPKIVAPEGEPPSALVKRDIVTGKGPKAKPGDQLTMNYVGVAWSNGQQCDASWDRGQTFPFQLGAQMVIPGWERGMVGMRKGGRRLLIIPPDLGYGAQGAGPIGPNETLVFAVDLEKIG